MCRPFLEMVDYLRNRRGVKVPIIPGILPILNTAQIKRFTNLCGAKIPPDLMHKLEAHAADNEAVRKMGVENATEMCQQLLAQALMAFTFTASIGPQVSARWCAICESTNTTRQDRIVHGEDNSSWQPHYSVPLAPFGN